ncbi:hypothetical protein O6H91_12G080400 [Diphasiastrum complanatum]|uniref:Uncharacterized protein n=1 Tax=Diphasiastrum complanatum TaxID=34168 RepID=A0ACC2C4D8_DIPCM|nr:hypothetical protein O6H91_12G080400 [Diphasiastrum complanatum]
MPCSQDSLLTCCCNLPHSCLLNLRFSSLLTCDLNLIPPTRGGSSLGCIPSPSAFIWVQSLPAPSFSPCSLIRAILSGSAALRPCSCLGGKKVPCPHSHSATPCCTSVHSLPGVSSLPVFLLLTKSACGSPLFVTCGSPHALRV